MIEIENTYGYFMSGFRDIGDNIDHGLDVSFDIGPFLTRKIS